MSWYRNLVWFTKGMREYTRSGYEAAATHFDPNELYGVRLDDRVVLITGANSGIGLACCKALCKRGAQVHMVCRNLERGQAAFDSIRSEAGDAVPNLHLHQLDMSQPKQVYAFTKKFAEQHQRLDVLINNAGCMVNTLMLDENGLEANFATNTLGTYLLTEGFIPILEKSKDPRVILVSSGGMLVQRLDHEDPALEKKQGAAFDGTMVYAQNKRQQVVLAEMWADAHPNISFCSMHPGWADTPAVASSMPSFHRRMEGKLRTPEQGADTVIWLALTSKLRSYPNGSFFQDRQPVSKHLPLARTHSSATEKATFMARMAAIAKPFMP